MGMRLILLVIFLIVAGMLAIGCSDSKLSVPTVNIEPIEVDVPKIDLSDLNMTCDKAESDVTFSDAAVANKIEVEDEIEVKDLVYIGCDYKVSKTERGVVREIEKKIEIPAPAGLGAEVASVEVTSARTCSVSKGEVRETVAAADKTVADILNETLNGGFEIQKSGSFSVRISGGKFNMLNQTKVVEGKNLLSISYFDSSARLIGTQEVEIDVTVKRVDVPGSKEINICTE